MILEMKVPSLVFKKSYSTTLYLCAQLVGFNCDGSSWVEAAVAIVGLTKRIPIQFVSFSDDSKIRYLARQDDLLYQGEVITYAALKDLKTGVVVYEYMLRP